MFWSLSLQLMPDEQVVEDSSKQAAAGVRPTYSVFLTNRRVAFRFDGFGSSMTQSFTLDEIVMAQPVKRMFITYLQLRTRTKEYFLHIPEPGYWSSKILDARGDTMPAPAVNRPDAEAAARRKRQELRGMLATLRSHGLLTEAEVAEKSSRVDQLHI